METFVRYCNNGWLTSLLALQGTLLSYIGHLFEEGNIRGNSVNQYISGISIRHLREGFSDSFLNSDYK